MQLPSPLVTGWLEEKRKPRDLTRALPMEIGSESEQEGSEERENLTGSDGKDSEGLGEGERLPCLDEGLHGGGRGEAPTDSLVGLLPTEDRLAEDLEVNLDRTAKPAEATAATDKEAEKEFDSLSSSCLLRMFLSSSPPTELTKTSSV